MQIYSFSPFGYEGSLVSVEVDLRRGIPAIDVVGLPDGAVRESRERMKAAIRNSGFEFPGERILISLSPADVKKEGAGFDLAIALGVLSAKNKVATENAETEAGDAFALSSGAAKVLVMGELELSGQLRQVRGTHAAISTAAELGIPFCIVPHDTDDDFSYESRLRVFPVQNLVEAFHVLLRLNQPEKEAGQFKVANDRKNDRLLKQAREESEFTKPATVEFLPILPDTDLSVVKHQGVLLRALQIAAAGAHNLMVYGPPGSGKTLALERFSSILPLLFSDEEREVKRIYSLAGFSPPVFAGRFLRPIRKPHQTCSLEGMIGGGQQCRPGEISLAHKGVLFLDEAAEFRSNVLQSLRVPLESGRIALSRAGRYTEFPAEFQLVLSANPCPCGNFGVPDKICVCNIRTIEQYWKKFSGPLLDRIDLRIPVFNNEPRDSMSRYESELRSWRKVRYADKKTVSSAELRTGVQRAVQRQLERQGCLNSRLQPESVVEVCSLSDSCRSILQQAEKDDGFSFRGKESIIKLARTIADIDNLPAIRPEHIEEASELHRNVGGVLGF